jgi:hypothetical protein
MASRPACRRGVEVPFRIDRDAVAAAGARLITR